MRTPGDSAIRLWVLGSALVLSGCERAPTFNAWGSYFPAWLACVAVAVLLTFGVNWLLRRLGIELLLPVIAYPSLAALFAFTLWLALFR